MRDGEHVLGMRGMDAMDWTGGGQDLAVLGSQEAPCIAGAM